MLHLCLGQSSFLRNRGEGEGALIGGAPKDALDERHEADLLSQERLVLVEDGLGDEVRQERLEGADAAAVEGVQQRR